MSLKTKILFLFLNFLLLTGCVNNKSAKIQLQKPKQILGQKATITQEQQKAVKHTKSQLELSPAPEITLQVEPSQDEVLIDDFEVIDMQELILGILNIPEKIVKIKKTDSTDRLVSSIPPDLPAPDDSQAPALLPKEEQKELEEMPEEMKFEEKQEEELVQAPEIEKVPEIEEQDSPASSSSSVFLLPYSTEIIPAIENLTIIYSKVTVSEIALSWQAPANLSLDCNYDLEYWLAEDNWLNIEIGELADPPYPNLDKSLCLSLTEVNKEDMVPVSEVPSVVDSKQEELKIAGLAENAQHCFVLRLECENRFSDFSNIVSARTLSLDMPLVGWDLTFSGELKQDAYFSREYSPYYLNQNWQISSNVKVEFEKGVVIKAAPQVKIQNYGQLVSHATQLNPVIFTSEFDDAYMGDTNNDASQTQPQLGNWLGIENLDQGSLQGEVEVLWTSSD